MKQLLKVRHYQSQVPQSRFEFYSRIRSIALDVKVKTVDDEEIDNR